MPFLFEHLKPKGEIMGTMYFQNTKEKPSSTNVYYKDLDNNLHVIRADTLDALEARASVADLLDE